MVRAMVIFRSQGSRFFEPLSRPQMPVSASGRSRFSRRFLFAFAFS
jgi:hypothetical protein